ncbi:CsiV family protein [Marinobacter sp. M216]|uniref:CsiV family protein n=1 Tax=Marinobacter albus TaxID=3030833 RepID=A0ABT7HAN6_9GAMM|nr:MULTISPECIES: CsiV family protein [unclassified Marinobacter]MDK9557424.1 CsiV family protein [Marinobacter sp. M216]
MQNDGNCGARSAARTVITALLLTFSLTAQSQEAGTNTGTIPDDYYRAELVVLERIVQPEAVNERMADRKVEPTPDTEEILRAVGLDGTAETSLDLAPKGELYLHGAAQRLERSGRYRVLVEAGWYEAFPPDYEGQPLRVAVGDWLDGANTREIEGTITIDRQRYLHVGVHLNHWQLSKNDAPQSVSALPDEGNQADPAAGTVNGTGAGSSDLGSLATGGDVQSTVSAPPVELLTWIRETRRMRSEEIHFLDSPTIGVLVFFKKIEASE